MQRQLLRSRVGRLVMPMLPLALFPSVSHAEAGELGGIAMAAFAFSSTVWVVLTLVVGGWFLRRLSLLKRLACTVLFFCLPALFVGGMAAIYSVRDEYANRPEITTQPLVVLGVTFPPGSQADYDGSGGFLGWGPKGTLQSIHSPHPVLLGKVPIDGLIFIPENCCDRARAEVSAGTIVDGLPCGDAVFDLTPAGPVLKSCFVAAPVLWRGNQLAAGSFVDLTAPPSMQGLQDTK